MNDISSSASTFAILFRAFGQTMTLEQLRTHFFPGSCKKTMHNRSSDGLLPPKVGSVYDTRDVAEWWDARRAEALRHANVDSAGRRRGSATPGRRPLRPRTTLRY